MSLVLTCDGCGKPIRAITLEERTGLWKDPARSSYLLFPNDKSEWGVDVHDAECLAMWCGKDK